MICSRASCAEQYLFRTEVAKAVLRSVSFTREDSRRLFVSFAISFVPTLNFILPDSMPLFSKKKYDEKITKKFDILGILGSGAFSDVHVCREKQTGKDYAVKCIKRKEIEGREEALENEILIHRKVKHPNVVELVQLFDNKEALYIVLELVTGGELFDRIVERGSYTERDASHLVDQILKGVSYLHSLDIVHRDLKPENLLFHDSSSDARLMITDFGLAKRTNEGPIQTACGTPGYVAPEVLIQKPYGKPVDCWAMGVITYILLCGYPPFYDEDDTQLYQQIARAEYEFDSPYWDEISTAAKTFVRSLMNKDPESRYTCQQALEDPWISGGLASEKDIHLSVAEQMAKNFFKRKWKQAFNAATAIRRMKSLTLS